jgi:hypothetical protein
LPISHENKIIFIHIPKNAGESIEKALGIYGNQEETESSSLLSKMLGKHEEKRRDTFWGIVDNRVALQHLTAMQLKEAVSDDPLWDSFFKFAVVRNPWTKAVSEYNWYLRYGPHLSFKEWVFTLETRLLINGSINILEFGHNKKQCEFVLDSNGALMLDRVLKFENLKSDFDEICRQNQWDVCLSHTKDTSSTSEIADFRALFDTQSIEEIERIYKDDIELFNYSKDETFGALCCT